MSVVFWFELSAVLGGRASLYSKVWIEPQLVSEGGSCHRILGSVNHADAALAGIGPQTLNNYLCSISIDTNLSFARLLWRQPSVILIPEILSIRGGT